MQKNGVLETIINTNATYLKGNYAEEIISSGLDLLIYSFDGGSKKLMINIELEDLNKTNLKIF